MHECFDDKVWDFRCGNCVLITLSARLLKCSDPHQFFLIEFLEKTNDDVASLM